MATMTAEKTCLKVRGDAKDLAEAVAIAASVTPPSKSPRPVLQNLLLDARDGVLEVTGSDLDVSVRVRIERVEVGQDGRMLVNAARFQQILRELVGEQVGIEADERAGCVIRTADSRFHVMGEEAEEFPELPAWKSDGAISLKAAELVEAIRRTHFAAHAEKTRYAMNGVLVDLQGSRLRLVATDGKRLSMVERPLTGEVGSKPVKAPVFVVVPTKGMTLLQRVVAAGEESVEVAVESSQVVFRTANATVLAPPSRATSRPTRTSSRRPTTRSSRSTARPSWARSGARRSSPRRTARRCASRSGSRGARAHGPRAGGRREPRGLPRSTTRSTRSRPPSTPSSSPTSCASWAGPSSTCTSRTRAARPSCARTTRPAARSSTWSCPSAWAPRTRAKRSSRSEGDPRCSFGPPSAGAGLGAPSPPVRGPEPT